jgi:hypothetical protein
MENTHARFVRIQLIFHDSDTTRFVKYGVHSFQLSVYSTPPLSARRKSFPNPPFPIHFVHIPITSAIRDAV